MFGYAVIKNNFEWVNFIKLILFKSEILNVKWFIYMFECVYVKVSWTINFNVKITFKF
jgi:hypothetical protein